MGKKIGLRRVNKWLEQGCSGTFDSFALASSGSLPSSSPDAGSNALPSPVPSSSSIPASPPSSEPSGPTRGLTVEELYGIPPGGFPPAPEDVVDLEAPPDTSQDEEFARALFVKLNRGAPRAPGEGDLVIIIDDDDEAPSPAPQPSSFDLGAPASTSGSASTSAALDVNNGGGDDLGRALAIRDEHSPSPSEG